MKQIDLDAEVISLRSIERQHNSAEQSWKSGQHKLPLQHLMLPVSHDYHDSFTNTGSLHFYLQPRLLLRKVSLNDRISSFKHFLFYFVWFPVWVPCCVITYSLISSCSWKILCFWFLELPGPLFAPVALFLPLACVTCLRCWISEEPQLCDRVCGCTSLWVSASQQNQHLYSNTSKISQIFTFLLESIIFLLSIELFVFHFC